MRAAMRDAEQCILSRRMMITAIYLSAPSKAMCCYRLRSEKKALLVERRLSEGS